VARQLESYLHPVPGGRAWPLSAKCLLCSERVSGKWALSTEIAARGGLLTVIASNILTRVPIADFMGDPTTGAIPTRFEARSRARERYRTACGPRDSREAAEVSAPISASRFGNMMGSVVAIRTSIVGALRRTAMAFMVLKRDFRISCMKAGENCEGEIPFLGLQCTTHEAMSNRVQTSVSRIRRSRKVACRLLVAFRNSPS
jgi:hypothetical protein